MKRILGAAVVVLLSASACTSSGGGDPSTDKYGLTQSGAKQSLIGTDQVGPGLHVSSTSPGDIPLPCLENGASLGQFQPRAHAAIQYSDDMDSFEFTEVVNNYDGAATAGEVMKTIGEGLSCQNAYIGRFAVTINGPVGVKLDTPVDASELYTLNASGAKQSVIVVQLKNAVVTLQFAAGSGLQANVDTASIAQRAVAKVASTASS